MRRKSWLWGVILFMGVTALLAHPADPNPALAQYAIFATDSIIFQDEAYGQLVSGQTIDSVTIPGPGLVGTNGVFDMSKIPSAPWCRKISVGTDLLVGGNGNASKFTFPASLGSLTQVVTAGKKITIDPAITTIGNPPSAGSPIANNIVRNVVTPPISSSANWYNLYPLSSFSSTPAMTQGTATTLTPGAYGTVNVTGAKSTLTLDCGSSDAEFYIQSLVLEQWSPSKIIIKE